MLARVPKAGTVTAAVGIMAPRVGVGRETLRRLRVENRHWRARVEILRTSSLFFFAREPAPRNR